MLLKASLIYLLSSVLSKLVPFLLLPLLTRYLAPAEFALIVIFQTLYSCYLALLGNIQASVPNAFIQNNLGRFSEKLSAILVLLFSFFNILGIASGILSVFFEDLFGLPEKYFWILPVVALMSALNLVNLALVRVREQPLQYMAWEVSHAILNILISLYLVIYISMGWEGRVLGVSIPITLYGAISFLALLRGGYLSFTVKIKDCLEVSKIAIPMIPHALSAVIITVSDNFMIAAFVGKESVSLYAVGYQFGMVIMLLTDAFSKAWQPLFYKFSKENQFDKIKIIQLAYYVILPIIAFLYGVLAYNLVPSLLDERYISSIDYIPVVVAAYVAMGIYQLYFPYLILHERTKILTAVTPVAALLNIILNFWWLPIYGAIGAAYATLISYLFTSLSLFFYCKKIQNNSIRK